MVIRGSSDHFKVLECLAGLTFTIQCFSQDISNGINIGYSCLNLIKVDMVLQPQPTIDKKNDPIAPYTNNIEFDSHEDIGVYFFGQASCVILKD